MIALNIEKPKYCAEYPMYNYQNDVCQASGHLCRNTWALSDNFTEEDRENYIKQICPIIVIEEKPMSELPWFYNIFNPEMIEEIKKKAREGAIPIEDLPEDNDWLTSGLSDDEVAEIVKRSRQMPEEVKEIIEELEKAVEPNDCGQGIVFAIQTIKAKYGIDDCEAYGVKRETIKPIPIGDWRLN